MTNPIPVAGALNVQRSGHEEAEEAGKDPTMKRLEALWGHGFSKCTKEPVKSFKQDPNHAS